MATSIEYIPQPWRGPNTDSLQQRREAAQTADAARNRAKQSDETTTVSTPEKAAYNFADPREWQRFAADFEELKARVTQLERKKGLPPKAETR